MGVHFLSPHTRAAVLQEIQWSRDRNWERSMWKYRKSMWTFSWKHSEVYTNQFCLAIFFHQQHATRTASKNSIMPAFIIVWFCLLGFWRFLPQKPPIYRLWLIWNQTSIVCCAFVMRHSRMLLCSKLNTSWKKPITFCFDPHQQQRSSHKTHPLCAFFAFLPPLPIYFYSTGFCGMPHEHNLQ